MVKAYIEATQDDNASEDPYDLMMLNENRTNSEISKSPMLSYTFGPKKGLESQDILYVIHFGL